MAIIGTVAGGREALIPLTLLGPRESRARIEAVVDTGFTGHLVLPPALVGELDLALRGARDSFLADGSRVSLDAYRVGVEWDDQVPDQIRDGVAVIVSTMQAMKREDKEGLNAYEDNGYLQAHFSEEDERAGATFSLFEVIRRQRPLIIADEGHNAKTVLALDLIESLEPSCVLELTATPADRSNVLSEVSALELNTRSGTGYRRSWTLTT